MYFDFSTLITPQYIVYLLIDLDQRFLCSIIAVFIVEVLENMVKIYLVIWFSIAELFVVFLIRVISV